MSDILDIESQFGSEFGEDELSSLKQNAKMKKGRGFLSIPRRDNLKNRRSALNKKFVFDKLDHIHGSCEIKRKLDVIPQKSVEGWTIFVTQIHEEATEEDLREVFSEYGYITYFTLNLDRRTGFIKGYAIIEYKTFSEAFNTIENLNDVEFLGQTVKVNWAFVVKR